MKYCNESLNEYLNQWRTCQNPSKLIITRSVRNVLIMPMHVQSKYGWILILNATRRSKFDLRRREVGFGGKWGSEHAMARVGEYKPIRRVLAYVILQVGRSIFFSEQAS